MKHVTTDTQRRHSVLEPNYYTIKWFSENLLKMTMNKINLQMNKPVYLDLSVLEIRKMAM